MRLFAGLMSGTSADGVDGVVAAFQGERPVRLLACRRHPWPAGLGERIQALMSPGADEIERAGALHVELGEVYADCIGELIGGAGIDRSAIEAIGCHGQTVRHCPDHRPAFTVQLGSGAVLAQRTGIAVVCDFRSADMAAGGQGAPLAPAFHAAAFHAQEERRVIVNLGGIANVTCLSPAHGDAVTGFDTGPANTLLDGWVRLRRGAAFDEDGRWARSGHCDDRLLATLLADPYFSRPPPKSTGRERFNMAWLGERLERHGGLKEEDVQCTLVHLSARSIADAIDRHCAGAQAVYLCGGGAGNGFLRDTLAGMLKGRRLGTTAALGIEPEWVEAGAFAWLAKCRVDGQPGNLPAVTGASRAVVLGSLYRP